MVNFSSLEDGIDNIVFVEFLKDLDEFVGGFGVECELERESGREVITYHAAVFGPESVKRRESGDSLLGISLQCQNNAGRCDCIFGVFGHLLQNSGDLVGPSQFRVRDNDSFQLFLGQRTASLAEFFGNLESGARKAKRIGEWQRP